MKKRIIKKWYNQLKKDIAKAKKDISESNQKTLTFEELVEHIKG